MLRSHALAIFAVTTTLVSSCGTLSAVETLHPEIAKHGPTVAAFAACLDLLTAPLVKSVGGQEKLDPAAIVNLSLEAARCALHVQADSEIEQAKDATVGAPSSSGGEQAPVSLGAPAGSFPLPAKALPATPSTLTPEMKLQMLREAEPNPYAG